MQGQKIITIHDINHQMKKSAGKAKPMWIKTKSPTNMFPIMVTIVQFPVTLQLDLILYELSDILLL